MKVLLLVAAVAHSVADATYLDALVVWTCAARTKVSASVVRSPTVPLVNTIFGIEPCFIAPAAS